MKFKIHMLLSVLLMLGSVNTFAQIGIGTTTPAPSAALEVSSIGNNKGILIPRLTAIQKDAIVNPAEGLLVYQTTAPIGFYYYTNTVWKLIITQTELDKKSSDTETQSLLNVKENTANKSTDVSLADASNVRFPTELAVRTYVTGQITAENAARATAIAGVQAALQSNLNTLSSTVVTNTNTTNTAIELKENTANKSTDVSLADASNVKFPTELAVKTYVDAQVAGATIADADGIAKGKIQLAGDLGGTAASPTVPGLALKADLAAVANGLALKAPVASPIFSGTVAIGTANPSAAAVLDITSTSKGLLLPRLTFAQKSAIVSPEAGLILWCSDCGLNGELQVYNGTNFVNMVGSNAQFALPTVSATSAATAITSSALTSGGSIESDGGAFITARGVVWSTSTNPTVSLSTKTTDGTGIGNFSSSLSGLTSGITYYVRAYGTNNVGTKYGPEITVNTAQAIATLGATITESAIDATSATSGGNITYDGGATVTLSGVVWSTISTPTIAFATKTTDGAATGTFTSNISGLTPGTLYYVRSYATNSVGTNYGAQISFTTLNTATISATTSATSITGTTATSGGTITSDGGATVTARGVVWDTSIDPVVSLVTKTTDATGTGTYTSSITGLTPATVYYYRSYATNSVGTVYGTQAAFTTNAIAPTLTTTTASSITKYAASAGGSITSNGGSAITVSGICWSTTATPTTSDFKTTDGTTSGTYTGSITGLTAGTTYYVRSYATNGIGTSYGAAQSFTTLSTLTLPTLPTVGSSYGGGVVAYVYQDEDPGYTSSNIPVLITGNDILGFTRWYNGSNTTTGATATALGTGSANTNAITADQGASTGGYKYAAALAKAYNGGGFTDWYLPSQDELNKLFLNKDAIGGFDGTMNYFWASTELSASHVILQNFLSDTTTLLPFPKFATGGTVRAVRTITLAPSNNPTLATTTTATGVSSTTATTGGNVTDEGATQVSIRGLVYGTSTGSSTFSVTVGSGAGTFTSTLTGLTPGTTYYVRSFATNVQGTSYGAETSFTTQTTPTVSVTATPTSLTTTSAVGGGTISSSGGATITTSGLVWDASVNPTIALSTKTTDGTTTGTFTSSITGLIQGATYHVRAYATNYLGTSYGPDVTFTTLTTPTISATASVTSITGTTATSGGTITTDGGAGVPDRGLVWGTSTGSSTYSVTTGTGTGSYTSSLTGLSIGTTYYVRAFATNSVGTVYGPEVQFNTPSLPTLTASAITIGNNATGVSATLTSELTSDGGATSTRGFVYGIGNFNLTATATGSGIGTYSAIFTGLTPGSTYQVKTFATNSAGTVYGSTLSSFTTPNTATLASTYSATNISGTSAESGGNITADGGVAVTERGLVWGTTSNPTIALTTRVAIGSGTGIFTGTLTGLSGGNTYFVRSFATNSVGTSYGTEISFSTVIPTVTSAGGRIWMDRNLGATRAATSATDASSFGDLYQWGRGTDGHQLRNASILGTPSNTDSPGNNKFIKGGDWRSPKNDNLWQGITGTNNPCPSGFRLPTKAEWETEFQSWSNRNEAGAFASPLKLPSAGYRDFNDASISYNFYHRYWSSTINGDQAESIIYDAAWIGVSTQQRGNGMNCRCIKE